MKILALQLKGRSLLAGAFRNERDSSTADRLVHDAKKAARKVRERTPWGRPVTAAGRSACSTGKRRECVSTRAGRNASRRCITTGRPRLVSRATDGGRKERSWRG